MVRSTSGLSVKLYDADVVPCFVVGMVLFGSVAKVALVWDLADLFMALMAITNLVRSRF